VSCASPGSWIATQPPELRLDVVEACDLGTVESGDLDHVDTHAAARSDDGNAIAWCDGSTPCDVDRRGYGIADGGRRSGVKVAGKREGIARRQGGP